MIASPSYFPQWLGQLISNFGDTLHYIALVVLVFQLTGHPQMLGYLRVQDDRQVFNVACAMTLGLQLQVVAAPVDLAAPVRPLPTSRFQGFCPAMTGPD